LLALLAQLATLTDAVTRLRENQDRAAQAAAARRAAEQLHLFGAQRSGSPAGAAGRTPVMTVARARAAAMVDDPSHTRPGPTQGPPGAHRGPRQ